MARGAEHGVQRQAQRHKDAGRQRNADGVVEEGPEQVSWMFRRVARLSRMAAGTSLKRLFISTTSAASMATSVPAPMAMPGVGPGSGRGRR